MDVSFIDLKREYEVIKKKIDDAVLRVLKEGNFVLGEEVNKFEHEWARYLKIRYAVGVANGTDALYIALKALGIKQEDEVIVPSFTFIATAFAVSNVGATPVFVDVDPLTFNLDAKKLEGRITKKTKAIIPVHIYGNPCEMDKVLKIARENNLYIIEDAAQAHGASYKGKKAGTMGDIGCFSFYPTKNLGCFGDGGAIVTNNKMLAEKVRMIGNEGQKIKYSSEIIGTNSRLDELQAAILRVRLEYLNKWNKKRKDIAEKYKTLLQGMDIQFQKETEKSVFHVFPVLTKKRDELQAYLSRKGISTLIHYPISVHLQKTYKTNLRLPVSEKIASEELSLPMFPLMTDEELEYVAKAVKAFLRH